MRVGVLALQGDFREHAAALARAGGEPVLVRRAEDLEGLAGLVIPGGESTTIGSLAERYGLLEPLRQALAGGLPALGTCAGMIFLAGATHDGPSQPQLGVLDVVVERNAFGRQAESFEAEIEVAGLDPALLGVFIRAPRVRATGPGVEVLASLDGYPVMVRQGRLVATAFHPELTDDLRIHKMLLAAAGER